MNKIFLTGFMGSGKSTIGRKLAQVARREFIDLDEHIETKFNSKISKIFQEQGEERFRVIEAKCLDEVLKMEGSQIVSLGGGTICFFDNLNKIKSQGILIYLDLPPKAIFERIQNSKKQRPLLKNLKQDELLAAIEKRLDERISFYRQADIIVNGLNLTAQLLQHSIIEFQKKNND